MDLSKSERRPRLAGYCLTRKKFLSPDEQRHLTDAIDRNLKNPGRHAQALMLAVALNTGGRAQEILNLRKLDFDPHARTLFLTGLKGSSDREIPLPQWLGNQLIGFSKGLMPQDRFFPICYNRLRQIWVFWRPAQKPFHCLRHTFAINVYTRTMDVRLLQLALGHKNIINTMIYVDFVYAQSELKKRLLGG